MATRDLGAALALADRVPKRGIIMAAQGLNGAATVLLGVIILVGEVDFWDFIWFGFFNGTVLALSMPARQAMVPERLIFTAMGLTTTSWNLSRILGPALADDGGHGRTARQGPMADRHQHRLGQRHRLGGNR